MYVWLIRYTIHVCTLIHAGSTCSSIIFNLLYVYFGRDPSIYGTRIAPKLRPEFPIHPEKSQYKTSNGNTHKPPNIHPVPPRLCAILVSTGRRMFIRPSMQLFHSSLATCMCVRMYVYVCMCLGICIASTVV